MSEQSGDQAAAELTSHPLPAAATGGSTPEETVPTANTASGEGAAAEVESLGTALQRVANLGRE